VPDAWTDEQLDQAIADQPAGPEYGEEARARALVRIDAAWTEPVAAPSPHRRWPAAAAAVVLVAAGLFAVRSAYDEAPAASAAASLELAARGASKSPDEPLADGEYRYLASHSWALASAKTRTGKPLGALTHDLWQQWIPKQRSGEWLRRESTLDWRWVLGDEELARTEGDDGLLGSLKRDSKDYRGLCGDFPEHSVLGGTPDDGKPCDERRGSWHTPAPPFLADLPLDPEALYADLWTAAGGSAVEALDMATAVLSSPETPHALRAALYQALTRLPNLEITENTANLAGRTGVALGVIADPANPYLREDVIVDPDSGRFIGRRTVLVKPGVDYYEGLPAGTAVDFTAFVSGTVPGSGVEP
jgi:hypothetical protein